MWNQLTNREKQIAQLLLNGCDNKEIAEQAGITRHTVKAHFSKMFLRFQISGGMKRIKLATLLYEPSGIFIALSILTFSYLGLRGSRNH